LLAEVGNQVAERAIAIAERACNVLQGAVVQEKSTQGFIASMQALRGLEKIALTAGIVHGATSDCHIDFGSQHPLWLSPMQLRRKDKNRPLPKKPRN